MRINRNLLLFYLCRGLGLGLKPLILWCTLRAGAVQWSQFFAVLFFIIPATFIAFNNDGHIQYYKKRFGVGEVGLASGVSFRTYLSVFFSHLAIFSVAIVAFLALYFDDLISAIGFLMMIVNEKIWDELQRYQLFARRYEVWSAYFLSKAAIPFGALFFSILFHIYFPLAFMVILSTMVNLVALRMTLSARARHLMIRIFRASFGRRILSYFKVYKDKYIINQMASLAAGNLLAVDKWLGSSRWEPRTLVEVVLAGQFGSAFMVLIDNLFLTANRDRYVKTGTTPLNVVRWDYVGAVTAVSVLGFGVMVYFFKSMLGFQVLTVYTVLSVFLASILVGLSRPIAEYVFWHRPRSASLMIDAGCIGGMYLVGRLIFSPQNLMPLYGAMIAVLSLRIVLFFSLALPKG